MKHAMLTLTVIFAFLSAAVAQDTKWSFDKAHTNIAFKATHMVISTVNGEFQKYDGTVWSDKDDFTDAKIELTIQVNSINTGIEKRDNHLKSDDFFNAEKYPTMTFKSKNLKKVSGNQYKLTGDLTIRDVTKTVELDVTYGGTIKDPYGNTRAGFKITGTINRFDYNLKWDATLDTGGLVVGKEITIDCGVEIVKQ